MHDKYKTNKWYRNLSFSQNTFFFKNDTLVKTEIWHELLSSPGNLIIKYNTPNSTDGALFNDSKVYVFQKGKQIFNTNLLNELLLVGFDVYFSPPQKTISTLDSLGFDLSKLYSKNVNGRKTYVTGTTDSTDFVSPQIWIDVERLYLYRIIYKQRKNIRDVTFSRYELLKNNWVATQIIFYENGKLQIKEDYFNITFPKKVNENLFNPTYFNQVSLKSKKQLKKFP